MQPQASLGQIRGEPMASASGGSGRRDADWRGQPTRGIISSVVPSIDLPESPANATASECRACRPITRACGVYSALHKRNPLPAGVYEGGDDATRDTLGILAVGALGAA